jgi:hypothetical protein
VVAWYKNFALDSGAYNQEILQGRRQSEFWAYACLQVFKHSLGGYSHRERWARTRRYFLIKHCAKVLLPSGASFYGCRNPNIFSQNLTATWDSRVALSQRDSNAVTCHEGKTPGSVLCGLVYAHGCALLVSIRVYDAKKILVDALGTLRITLIHSL